MKSVFNRIRLTENTEWRKHTDKVAGPVISTAVGRAVAMAPVQVQWTTSVPRAVRSIPALEWRKNALLKSSFCFSQQWDSRVFIVAQWDLMYLLEDSYATVVCRNHWNIIVRQGVRLSNRFLSHGLYYLFRESIEVFCKYLLGVRLYPFRPDRDISSLQLVSGRTVPRKLWRISKSLA
jgi:hypothetical protein